VAVPISADFRTVSAIDEYTSDFDFLRESCLYDIFLHMGKMVSAEIPL
jgi:hypothetical protein